jgi:galactokinase
MQRQPNMTTPFKSIAPGRLCLFGEHSDYLNLPVIAAALPLRCEIHVTPTPDSLVLIIDMPCLNKGWRCDLNDLPLSPAQPGDFALAAVHEALVDGWELRVGAKCVSTTDIPLQAGCSSSSAFTVAWVQALAKLAGKTLSSPLELAKMAHKAEVTHFGAPGGTMDHITIALGGTLRIGPGQWQVQRLANTSSGVWVLADSGELKDTIGHLTRCKDDRLALFHKLGNDWDSMVPDLNPDEVVLLEATRTNIITENMAATIWDTASGEELGALMLQHHEALRDGLRLSTDRLEDMRQAAMDNGAWGFKVVGSGGGGCAVAWTPRDNAKVVASAVEDAGAVRTFVITESCDGAFVRQSK